MSLEHIDPYPWFLSKPLDLVVNDQLVRTRITATEWADHWRPLLGRLYSFFDAHLPKRFVVAVAGPPGSGKSIIAEQLHWIISRQFFHKKAASIALPMDGFHYSNAYLESHKRKLPDGREIPLSSVKGQPDTIDVKSLRRALQTLIARPDYMPWPGYSRFTHDIVPDKYHVSEAINIVLVEGNYLLIDRGPFAGVPGMFNLRIYVECPAAKIIANLVDRHIRGGMDLNEAKDWVKRIDLPNARAAESTRHNADVIIEKDTFEDVVAVTWKGEEAASTRSTDGEVTETNPAPPVAAAVPAPAVNHASSINHVALQGSGAPIPSAAPPAAAVKTQPVSGS